MSTETTATGLDVGGLLKQASLEGATAFLGGATQGSFQRALTARFGTVLTERYGPALAAQYFKKLECFCFTKQAFAAHEKRPMPVVFLVDPKLPKDIEAITLSYTFFVVEGSGS